MDIESLDGRYGSATQVASLLGYEKIVQSLVNAGANTNVASRKCAEPLELVMSNQRVGVFDLLVQHGAHKPTAAGLTSRYHCIGL